MLLHRFPTSIWNPWVVPSYNNNLVILCDSIPTLLLKCRVYMFLVLAFLVATGISSNMWESPSLGKMPRMMAILTSRAGTSLCSDTSESRAQSTRFST